jgi:hypothetical protein
MATTKRARAKKGPEPETEAPSKPVSSSSRTSVDSTYSPDLQEAIRQRAYEIYQQRGGKNGTDMEDWILAEREILDRSGRRTA